MAYGHCRVQFGADEGAGSAPAPSFSLRYVRWDFPKSFRGRLYEATYGCRQLLSVRVSKGCGLLRVVWFSAGRTGAQIVAVLASRVRVSGQTAAFCRRCWADLQHQEQPMVVFDEDAGVTQAEHCVASHRNSEVTLLLDLSGTGRIA